MSSTRRVVRATSRFFEDLDRQLRPERGPNGEPSTNDFQVFELIRIVDRFAVEFDDLPRLITERDDYRILVMSGTLLARRRQSPDPTRYRDRREGNASKPVR